MKRVSLQFALAVEPGKPPPGEFRIFPSGAVDTTKGRFTFDATSVESVMRLAADWGNEYPIDYNHGMVDWLKASPDNSKAAGWFKPEVREGALWAANVSWTPDGSKYLANREYRYTSPTFLTDDENVIRELVNVALTNLPATKGQEPLVAHRADDDGKESTMVKQYALALQLREDATEAEVLAAIVALQKVKEEADGKVKATLEELAKASGMVAQLKKEALERRVDSIIEKALSDRKLTPAMKDTARTIGLSVSVEALEDFVAKMPEIVTPPVREKEDGKAPISLSADEQSHCQKFGIDPAKYAAHKAKLLAERAAARA